MPSNTSKHVKVRPEGTRTRRNSRVERLIQQPGTRRLDAQGQWIVLVPWSRPSDPEDHSTADAASESERTTCADVSSSIIVRNENAGPRGSSGHAGYQLHA